jgi:hypothetical protein
VRRGTPIASDYVVNNLEDNTSEQEKKVYKANKEGKLTRQPQGCSE